MEPADTKGSHADCPPGGPWSLPAGAAGREGSAGRGVVRLQSSRRPAEAHAGYDHKLCYRNKKKVVKKANVGRSRGSA